MITSHKDTIKATRVKPLKDALADMATHAVGTPQHATAKLIVEQQVKNKIDAKALGNLEIPELENRTVLENLTTNILQGIKDDSSKAEAVRRAILAIPAAQRPPNSKLGNLHKWLTSGKGNDFGI